VSLGDGGGQSAAHISIPCAVTVLSSPLFLLDKTAANRSRPAPLGLPFRGLCHWAMVAADPTVNKNCLSSLWDHLLRDI
jgi:hypothetical protein